MNAILLYILPYFFFPFFQEVPGKERLINDLVKINDAYKKVENLQVEVSYEEVLKEQHRALADFAATIKKKGERFYQQRSHMETIINDRYKITIDHSQKWMMVADAGNFWEQMNVTENFLAGAMYSVSSIKYEDSGNNTEKVTMNVNGTEYEALELVYSKYNYLLRRLTFFFEDVDGLSGNDMQIIVHFDNNIGSPIPDRIFAPSTYFTIQRNQIVPSPSYEGYRVQNALN